MLPTDADAATVLDFGSHWAVRTGTLAFSAEPDLARQILGDRSVWKLQEPEEVDALLAAATPAIDLLAHGPAPQDARAPKCRRRRVAWLAAALALSPALLTGAQALRHTIAGHALQTQAAERAAQLLQLQEPPADIAAHAADALASLQAPERLAGTAGALFDAMAQLEGAYLASLRYKNGRIDAEIVHPDPRHGETLLATLAEAGVDARILDSRPVADGVRRELQLEGRR
jgi:general secretion pathway protein L